MSSGHLAKLRESRNYSQTLKIKLLIAISTRNNRKVFIFEGDEDFSMYENWINTLLSPQSWIHVCGNGKYQLISLYKELLNHNDDEILPYCYFFVDQDYDSEKINEYNFLTLSCYSAENHAINSHSISSILKDEFHLNGQNILTHDHYLEIYKEDYKKFILLAKIACKPFFVKHNQKCKTQHYDKISNLIKIELNNIEWVTNHSSQLIDFDNTSEYALIFDNLPDHLSIKGKYVFEFAKKWLSSLKKELKNLHNIKIKSDPLMLGLRRFASVTPIPSELKNFLQKIM